MQKGGIKVNAGLLKLAGMLGRMDSNVRLHAFVYLAQEIGNWTGTQYEFDFSLNLPFSPELEDDFITLQKVGKVRHFEKEYVVQETLLPKEDEANLNILKELATWDTGQLVGLARLLYLRRVSPDTRPSWEGARRLFLMSKENFDRLTSQAEGLQLALATKG